MATWDISELNSGGIAGGIHNNGTNFDYKIEQDEKPFLEEAKRDRDNGSKSSGKHKVKKFATIPDLVSMEILTKYGINIHDPSIMQDKHRMTRFKHIIATEYKYLLAF